MAQLLPSNTRIYKPKLLVAVVKQSPPPAAEFLPSADNFPYAVQETAGGAVVGHSATAAENPVLT